MDTGPASAADRAYEFVRTELLARRIAPHALLSEGEVAEAVGVSRTPVREALLRLQGEGFLRLLPKRGALVLAVTSDEMADVIETRRLLEGYAARKAISGGSTADLCGRLGSHIETMRGAAKERDTRAYVEADRAFHCDIVGAAGNEIISSLYRSLRDRQLRMGAVNLADDSGKGADAARMRAMIADHDRILDSIRARSLRGTDAAVAAHLDHAAALINRRP